MLPGLPVQRVQSGGRSSPFGTVLSLSLFSYGCKLPQSKRVFSRELTYARREECGLLRERSASPDPPVLREHPLCPLLAFFLAFLGLFVPYPDDAFLTKMKLGKQPRLWSRFCHH